MRTSCWDETIPLLSLKMSHSNDDSRNLYESKVMSVF